MKVRMARGGAVLFLLLFVVAVTWPGMKPFNTIEPYVLGLPFSMAWIAIWVVLSFLVLVILDWVEEGNGSGIGDSPSGVGGGRPEGEEEG